MFDRYRAIGIAVAAAVALLASATHAQAPADYPRQPITVVVGASPGGPLDTATRLVTERLRKRLGPEAVILIDNKPGANGRISGAQVAKAPADGYMLLTTAAGHVINPALYQQMTYDPLKDLVPVAFIAYSRTVIAVTPHVPAKTMQELVAWGKANPGRLSYASGGSGSLSHLLAALLASSAGAAGVEFLHVPYKSGTAAVSDLVSGRVTFLFDSVQQMAPLALAGKVQLLGITADTRLPALPNVPTMKEAGFPEATGSSWLAFFAPARTPQAILQRLNTEINEVLRADDVKASLAANGFEHVPMTLDQLNQFVLTEAARWGAAVKAAGIKPE